MTQVMNERRKFYKPLVLICELENVAQQARDVKHTKRMVEAVTRLREMSPLYEMAQEGIDLKSVQWAAH